MHVLASFTASHVPVSPQEPSEESLEHVTLDLSRCARNTPACYIRDALDQWVILLHRRNTSLHRALHASLWFVANPPWSFLAVRSFQRVDVLDHEVNVLLLVPVRRPEHGGLWHSHALHSVSHLDCITSAVFTDGLGKICVVDVLAESFVSGSCEAEVSGRVDVGLRYHAREYVVVRWWAIHSLPP